MRRILIIVGIVLFLLAGGYATYVLLTRTETPNTPDGSPDSASLPLAPALPDAPSGFPNAPIPTDPNLIIQGAKGSVTVNNFYTDAHLVTGTDVFINSSLEYEVSFARITSIFTIKLFPTSNATYRTYRAQGEAYLLSALGITRTEACRLNITVVVPDSYIEGSELTVPAETGLSGCTASAVAPE